MFIRPRHRIALLTLLLSTSALGPVDAGELRGRQSWDLDHPGISAQAADLDAAGTALAAADFDGDGFEDLAVGIPLATVDGKVGAGRVLILRGSAQGLTSDGHFFLDQTFSSEGVETGDGFGTRLTVGDLNGDRKLDLVVGVPFEDVKATDEFQVQDAGAIQIFWGGPLGLLASNTMTIDQGLDWIAGSPQIGGGFGWSLDTGVFEDHRNILVVGAPFDRNANGDAVGSVHVLTSNFQGLSNETERYLPAGIGEDPPTPPTPPAFGWSVALGDFVGPDPSRDLAVGMPGYALERGRVVVLENNPDPFETEFLPYEEVDGAGNGDQLGWSLARIDIVPGGQDELAVSAPGVDAMVGDLLKLDAGWVGIADFANADPVLVTYLDPSSAAIAESAETGDRFGQVLAAVDADRNGFEDLLVGVPDEDIFSIDQLYEDVGIVHVFFGPYDEMAPLRQAKVHLGSDGLAETVLQDQARFGSAVATGFFDGHHWQLALGAPGEDAGDEVEAGGVAIFDGSLFSDGFESGDVAAWSDVEG